MKYIKELMGLSVISFSGCMGVQPFVEPAKGVDSGHLTIYHASPSMNWRTNVNLYVNGQWFDGLRGGDYNEANVPVGDLNLTVGLNADKSTLRTHMLRIQKNEYLCIKVDANIDGFYWFDGLGINDKNSTWGRVDEATCIEAIKERSK